MQCSSYLLGWPEKLVAINSDTGSIISGGKSEGFKRWVLLGGRGKERRRDIIGFKAIFFFNIGFPRVSYRVLGCCWRGR